MQQVIVEIYKPYSIMCRTWLLWEVIQRQLIWDF